MDDNHWNAPGKRKLFFRVPAGVAMMFVGVVAAFFLQQPLDERTAQENDLAALLGLTIGGAVTVLGLLLLLSGVRAMRRAKRIEVHGVPATGVVTAQKRLGGDSSAPGNYRSTIVLDTPVGGLTETYAVGSMPPARGDTVLVRLDPEDPAYSVVEGYRRAPLPETSDPMTSALRAGQRGVYVHRP